MKKTLILLSILIFSSCTQTVTSYSELEIVQQKENKENQKIEIDIGEKIQVEGKVQFSNGKVTTNVIWKTENEKIASVDSQGFIQGISAGKVNIILASKEEPNQSTKLEILVKESKEKKVEIASDSIVLSKEDQEYLKKVSDEMQKKQIEDNKKPYPVTFMMINVYDNNNDIVKDINISANSLTKGISWSFSKKSDTGSILIEDVPSECLIEFNISKEKWNTKRRLVITKGQPRPKNNPLIINFGENNDKFYALQFEPEISKITFNSKEVTGINYENNIDYLIPPDRTESGFKVKSPLSKISISFNKPMNKKSFEDSLEIISQKDSKGDFNTLNKTNGLYFTWDRFDSNVDIITNLSTNDKTLYRLQFKNGFSDIENNQARQGRYISFQEQELYNDYLNFLIEK